MLKSRVFLLCILFFLTIILSLSIGDAPLSLLLKDHDLLWTVIKTLRLPRTLLAIMTGATLGLTGAALQGFLRNPLADSGIMGISSAASFGAVFALALGCSSFLIPLFGILGAILVTTLLYRVLSKKPNIVTLVLIGLALNSFLSSLTALTLNFSKNPYKSLEIMFWLLGSFSRQPLENILFALPPVIVGGFLIWSRRYTLDALSLGEDMALSMGHSIKRGYQILIIGTALCIGPLVALGGIVGFVGLITPHILRQFIKANPSNLLLPSALGGAFLCLVADISVRLFSTGTEIKIGVITSLLGAPFFLYLILKKQSVAHDSF